MSETASVQRILDFLQGHSPMTGKQLRENLNLPRRTLYTALQRLRELGLLAERRSLKDSRQTYFWIPSPPTGTASDPAMS